MARRRSRDQDEASWTVEGVGEAAQASARQAAAAAGVALEIWLADTVLRATQEGVSEAETQRKSEPPAKPRN
ncbi:MAG: hypothetical protein AB7G15_19360 [Alphaproteobacteria bacterium]